MRIAVALMFLVPSAGYAQTSPTPTTAPQVAATVADGSSRATAIKVASVSEEYKIARKMKLQPVSQSLMTQGGTFDILNCVDEEGKPRELWFDISSFFGRF